MRVLLVDDHVLFREGVKALLTSRGIDVVGTAGDGLEALAQARALHPDLILMDIRMPRCDGLTATRLIKAGLPDVKIVMLTVSTDEEELVEAIRCGATGYLLKDLEPHQFFEFLDEVVQGGTPFSTGLAQKALQKVVRQSSPAAGHSAQEKIAPELTRREVEILALVARGVRYKEVATALCLTERTVKYHMGEILRRLQLKNRAAAIAYAKRIGLVADEGPAQTPAHRSRP